MANETNDLTKQEQLEQWAKMVQECESRPAEMSVKEWCEQNDISKDLYYYRKRAATKAGLLPEKSKKRKSKPKRKAKKSSATEVAVETPITETEIAEGNLAEIVTEPAVEETAPVEATLEEVTESVEKVAEPVKEENTPIEESTTEEPVVETATPTNSLDITIGSAVIHVNDKTSPELLSKTVQSLVSAMQTK